MLPSRLRRLGWIAFALMWLPFAGMFIGMIGLPDGSYAWAELPPLTRYSLIATGVLFLITMVSFPGGLIINYLSNRRLRARGRRAEAEILDLYETGTTINQHPIVGFKLRVFPLSGAPFEAQTEQKVLRLQVPQIHPGARIEVRYDPESKQVAILDTES